VVSETGAVPFRLRGESTTTYASSKLNRVGRRAARYDSELLAHKCNRPAHKRLTPHRIAHGQIACSRSRCGNLSTIHLSPVNIHSQILAMQPTLKHNHARYDAAGNVTQSPDPNASGTLYYGYDAENHMTSLSGDSSATYIYDAEGNRIRKVTGGVTTDYAYGASGNVVAEWSGGVWSKGYVYSGTGQLVAQYNGVIGATGATTLFVHKDHLGSTRVLTTVSATVSDSMDYLPFGEQIAGATGSSHKFTGKERDTESDLDDFEARYYSSSLGRFMSPDEFKGGPVNVFDPEPDPPGPLPYAQPSNPQSLNKYTYAFNNPMCFIDPDGHKPHDNIDILTNGDNHVTTTGFQDAKQLGPAQRTDGVYLNLNVQVTFDKDDNLAEYKVTREAVVITEPNNKEANRSGDKENPSKDQVADEGNSKFVYDGPGKHPDQGKMVPSINAGYDAVFKLTLTNTNTGEKTNFYYRLQFVIKNGQIDKTSIHTGQIDKAAYDEQKAKKAP
jgi:RHS repeat-associated protein